MFETPGPRVFGLPPGADFPKALISGLEQRLSGKPPHAWAEVEIYVNTRRMQRRLLSLFDEGPARLLPRIRLVTELGGPRELAALPHPVSPLRRRLALAELISRLLDAQPDLAPTSAIFDLSDSLAGLFEEMQGEGVVPATLRELDVAHHSAHWQRTRQFLEIIEPLLDDGAPDAEGRRRHIAEALVGRWQSDPPEHPVIVAGSTGSRGVTALFMEAVARLPDGAVVLPGYDFDQPNAVWQSLDDALTAEDHPQFRFRQLIRRLDIPQSAVRPWCDPCPVPSAARNRLVSLALRPAPVTDQWLDEGRNLKDIAEATAAMTLIEAPSPREEALAVALRLRQAAEDGVTAALVTPSRTLTRQVAAALDRWHIEPDDSAGLPLPLSAPGRFLRHVAGLFGQKLTSEALLVLLKHPLTASSPDTRGPHLLWTRELELHVRRFGMPYPSADDLLGWARRNGREDDGRLAWAGWLADTLSGVEAVGTRPLSEHVAHHVRLAEALARGPASTGSGGLWQEPAGEEAQRAVDSLRREADHAGSFSARDYDDLFRSVLDRHEVHDPKLPHPRIMFWGTLEARVQGAELVILGGLNEGSWPEMPPPDPWLNREMRKQAGLLLPDRRIGLSAHDYQQAIAAREVVLSRSIRDAEAETVASRWLNRLVNLLGGLEPQGGVDALDAMRKRGQRLVSLGLQLDQAPAGIAGAPAPRPSPCPPPDARPNRLSVTRIQTLIRDPYAIYAAYVLALKKLDPLRQTPGAPLRGTILHKVMERFIRETTITDPEAARDALMAIADELLAAEAPWPAARRIWRARLAKVADWFVEGEKARQAEARWAALEVRGEVTLANGFVLVAEADRIDRRENGHLVIYDYKTGTPPSKGQVEQFDKQLLLEAAMAERGGFEGVAAAPVDQVAYIGLGPTPKFDPLSLKDDLIENTWAGLARLIDRYRRADTGYAARRALFRRGDVTDYDHLSRYGEWDESTKPIRIRVGR